MADQIKVTETHTTLSEEGRPSRLSTILAVLGLAIVVVIVIWGLLHLATLISPWLSSRFSVKPVATLTVQAPTTATSSEPFTVRWTYDASVKGSYAFVYPCQNALHFTTTGTQGTESIPCGTAFSVSGGAVTVTPVLTSTTTIAEPLTIFFAPVTGAEISGSATVAVRPAPVSTPAPQKPSAPITYGPADLSATIISATVDQNGFGTVVFDIANNGNGASGNYYFEAYLPTRSAYTYYSPLQVSLASGSHIVNTLRFTQGMPGAVSIIVDPSQSVNDTNRANNYAGATMSAPYGYNPQPYTGQPTYVY